MNDLSTETTGRALMVEQAPSPSGNLLAQIVEAARDPTVDAGKMEAMANLAMKLQDRELQAQFNRDLASAIMEMPRISKRGVITIPAKDGRPERGGRRNLSFHADLAYSGPDMTSPGPVA